VYATFLCNFYVAYQKLGLMILLVHLKICACILNFAGAVFEVKVTPAKDPHQQISVNPCQEILPLICPYLKVMYGA
jgi:hypothetical protein